MCYGIWFDVLVVSCVPFSLSLTCFFFFFCIYCRFLICGYYKAHVCLPVSTCFKLVVIQFKCILKDLQFYSLPPCFVFLKFHILHLYDYPFTFLIVDFTFIFLSFNIHARLFKWLVYSLYYFLLPVGLMLSYRFLLLVVAFSFHLGHFSISFWVGLVLINSFSFCLSKKFSLLQF